MTHEFISILYWCTRLTIHMSCSQFYVVLQTAKHSQSSVWLSAENLALILTVIILFCFSLFNENNRKSFVFIYTCKINHLVFISFFAAPRLCIKTSCVYMLIRFPFMNSSYTGIMKWCVELSFLTKLDCTLS